MNVFELNGPVTSEYADHAGLCTRVVEAYANSVRSASVEDCNRRSGINQSTKCPLASLAVFQAHVNSRPKDSRVALLPIWKETIHRVRLADADNYLIRVPGNELSYSAVACLS